MKARPTSSARSKIKSAQARIEPIVNAEEHEARLKKLLKPVSFKED